MRGVPGRLIPAYLIAYVLIGVGLAVSLLMVAANGGLLLAVIGLVALGFTIRAEEKGMGR